MMTCAKCKQPISCDSPMLPFLPEIINPAEYVTYSGLHYHKSCFTLPQKYFLEPTTITLTMKLSDIISIIDDICDKTVHPPTLTLLNKLALSVAEHNNDYTLCANCNKLILRKHAVIGGVKTRLYQQALTLKYAVKEKEENIPQKHGPTMRTFVFCDNKCDAHFASVVHKRMENRIKESVDKYKSYEDAYNRNCVNMTENKEPNEVRKIKDALFTQLSARKKMELEKCRRDLMTIVKNLLG